MGLHIKHYGWILRDLKNLNNKKMGGLVDSHKKNLEETDKGIDCDKFPDKLGLY